MQEILTYIIVASAFGYVGVKTFLTFKGKSACEDECSTCAGCHLKDSCSIPKTPAKFS